MILQPPAELKLIRPFVHRGNQMEKLDPVITYYCYYYAVRQALENQLHTISPECTEYISKLMEDLETRKQALEGDDRIADDLVGRVYVENFAQKIFDNGSKPVEEGRANDKTPDTLQAAAVFLELSKVFSDELDPEIARKIKYAKFHAARILKALKDGTNPNPPPPESEPRAPPPPPTQVEEIPDEALAPIQHGESSGFSPLIQPVNTPPIPVQAAPSPFIPPASSPVPPPALSSRPTSGSYFPSAPSLHDQESVPPTLPPAPTAPEIPGQNAPRPEHTLPPTLPPAPVSPPSFHQAPSFTPPVQQPSPWTPSAPPLVPTYQPSPAPSAPAPVAYYHPQPHIPPPQPASTYAKKTPSEEEIAKAQKFARWAISALDFEDVPNAIEQLRKALDMLGAGP